MGNPRVGRTWTLAGRVRWGEGKVNASLINVEKNGGVSLSHR
jgi:hypothetical protein